MRTIFIVNPESGNGEGLKQVALIQKIVEEEKLPYAFMYTEYPLHAVEIARSFRQSDKVRIIAVGGDGTLNEVLNGMNVGVPLGIIPCGSGNDFFRMITNKKVDRSKLIRDTLYGSVSMVDYGIMNGRKFLNSFSIGIDATITRKAKKLQSKSKHLTSGAYFQAALKEILSPKMMHVTLELADKTISTNALLISSLNGKWYGGGFKPAPMANIRDGVFEVSVVEFLTTFHILPLFLKYYKGTHGTSKAVTTFQANRFTLHTHTVVEAQIDGEMSEGQRFEVEVVRHGLALIVPKGEEYGIRS